MRWFRLGGTCSLLRRHSSRSSPQVEERSRNVDTRKHEEAARLQAAAFQNRDAAAAFFKKANEAMEAYDILLVRSFPDPLTLLRCALL